MDFEKLNEVVKFGRVPEEGLRAFIESSKTSHTHDPNSTAELVLADYLEEHDDPRHLIVRRDLSYRTGHHRGFWGNVHRHASELTGKVYHEHSPLKGGLVYTRTGDNGEAVVVNDWSGVYYVNWHSPHNGHTYGAVLTPDEFEKVKAHFDSTSAPTPTATDELPDSQPGD